MEYTIKYKTPSGRKGQHTFKDYTTAKEIYAAFTYNITIKSAKLYEVYNEKKRLLEKFTKTNNNKF